MSQRGDVYAEDRGNLHGGRCGRFSTGFRSSNVKSPEGGHAFRINREWRELKLCRAPIKTFKNGSLFLSLWPNMSQCPQSHQPVALLLGHFLCLLRLHSPPTILCSLPQFGLHVCFLCRPQAPRGQNGASFTYFPSPWDGRQ